ncbi:hypothetical protein N7467_007363 [Penicillium canescens]|nr:hypothetical protein N7467_007363 [Penicillium canescens]
MSYTRTQFPSSGQPGLVAVSQNVWTILACPHVLISSVILCLTSGMPTSSVTPQPICGNDISLLEFYGSGSELDFLAENTDISLRQVQFVYCMMALPKLEPASSEDIIHARLSSSTV